MAERNNGEVRRRFKARHRGRIEQVWIYLGKLLRMFIYQSDWKVLPMAALIAGLVGMVIRRRMFLNMEGTLMGSFALVCVAIWNGCFNSIQVICRERDVIKREHRSGMHISSYICAHMLYQLLLCAAQTGVTLYITKIVGVEYPAKGMFTPWLIVDFGISMLLITYASDMLSLWVSSLAHTTTTAMTIMPFVLIFQLVFSGGMLTLPAWTEPLTHFTISNPGLKVIAAQADTNNRPFVTISNMIGKMRDNEISATVSVGDALDLLTNQDNPTIAEIRAAEIGGTFTLDEVKQALEGSASYAKLREEHLLEDVTVGDVVTLLREDEEFAALRDTRIPNTDAAVGDILNLLGDIEEFKPLLERKITHLTTVGDVLDAVDLAGILEKYGDVRLGGTTTVGEIVDLAAANPDVQAHRDASYTFSTTLGKLLDIVGEENVKTFLEEKAAQASYVADYEYTEDNITRYWLHLALFILAFAALATITLEFIDKDKR
ncbi:MAG: ABC transporter permease [Clostridia bacterium]|nr:ABC transporter permease [Clostridia bacterium]